jgi:hypothetical protein
MCETSNKPALERVKKMFADDARGILHGHGIAGKTGHASAERAMQIIKRRAGKRGSRGSGVGLVSKHWSTWQDFKRTAAGFFAACPLCPET